MAWKVNFSIAKEDLFAGDCRNAIARDDDAGEVHGIGGRYWNDGGTVAGAGGAEGFDSLGERELLAAKAREETAATDLATSFETTEHAEQVAPFGGVGFSCEEVTEEDAVTAEELSGEGFEGGIHAAGLLNRGWGGVEFR